MSTRRTSDTAGYCPPDKGPDGRPLCRRCGKPVPKGRRAWCGNKCVHEHKLRSDPGYARAKVGERDHGVCCLCGLDCNRLVVGIGPLADGPALNRHGDARGLGSLRPFHWRALYWAGMGLGPAVLPGSRMTAWDMDHTVAVSEGGGECGLEGLRTLCWWCHRAQTAALRKRLAAAQHSNEGNEETVPKKKQRYTITVEAASSGHGFHVHVEDTDADKDAATSVRFPWQSKAARPTEMAARTLGQDWIEATEDRDAELAKLRKERSEALPGQLTELRSKMSLLEEQKKQLGATVKSLEVDAWNLVKDADNPQVRFDFSEPFAEQQELPGGDGIEDDGEPVADANGRHPDGPKAKGKKGKGAKKTPTNGPAVEREPHDDSAPLPPWNKNSGIVALRKAATARGIDIEGSPSKLELFSKLQAAANAGRDPSKVEWPAEGAPVQ